MQHPKNGNTVLMVIALAMMFQKGGRAAESGPRLLGSVGFSARRNNTTGHWLVSVEARTSRAKKIDVEASLLEESFDGDIHLSTTFTVSHEQPPPGYERMMGLGYYKMHADALPYHEALRACEAEGAHLMVIDSEAEAEIAREFFSRNPTFKGAIDGDYFRIGFHDLYQEGEFRTVLGKPLDAAAYFKKVPSFSNSASVNCGIVNKSGLINVGNCTYKRPFICERY